MTTEPAGMERPVQSWRTKKRQHGTARLDLRDGERLIGRIVLPSLAMLPLYNGLEPLGSRKIRLST